MKALFILVIEHSVPSLCLVSSFCLRAKRQPFLFPPHTGTSGKCWAAQGRGGLWGGVRGGAGGVGLPAAWVLEGSRPGSVPGGLLGGCGQREKLGRPLVVKEPPFGGSWGRSLGANYLIPSWGSLELPPAGLTAVPAPPPPPLLLRRMFQDHQSLRLRFP